MFTSTSEENSTSNELNGHKYIDMGQKLHSRVETWKKLLLDFGKRNRLINFLEGKRNNVKITSPSYDVLYERIVNKEEEMIFPYAKKMTITDDGEEIYDVVIKGNLETNKPVSDLQKTLKNLRYKANTSVEEQGINTLYLTFGMLKWKERDDSDQVLASPIILVPVRLLIESLTSPYRITMYEDDIVVNPTLAHKLDNDFGIIMSEFDTAQESPEDYLGKISKLVENKGWIVEHTTHLTNLSFLKINMYKDLERNEEKLSANSVISAIVGESDPMSVSEELNNFDHDKCIRPIDTFQVVDADSSQQDAVLLSKKGASFVLQGPPGTGKSQTITNIIAEAIADGKKVLFVSEKMAALQVVYNRLSNVGLSDFCFTLHSHKAKKKDILRDLANSINIDRTRVRDEALAQLEILERKRNELNQYQEELHTPTSELNQSIFTINGRLAKLSSVPDAIFPIESVDKVSEKELTNRIYLLNEFAKTIGKRSEDYEDNVWRNSNVKVLTNELRHDIDSNVSAVVVILNDIDATFTETCSKLGITIKPSLSGLSLMLELLKLVSNSPLIPTKWIYDDNISALNEEARKFESLTNSIKDLTKKLLEEYDIEVLDINAQDTYEILSSSLSECSSFLSEKDRNTLVRELRNIVGYVDEQISCIVALSNLANILSDEIGVEHPDTLQNLEKVYNVAKLLDHRITPHRSWFEIKHFVDARNSIAIDKERHNRVIQLRTKLQEDFIPDFIKYDCGEMLTRFNTEYIPTTKKINPESIDFSDCSAISKVNTLIGQIKDTIEKLYTTQDCVKAICNYTGIDTSISLESANTVISFAQLLCDAIYPAEIWFDNAQYSHIKATVKEIADLHKAALTVRNDLLQYFDNNILSVNLYPMLQRFRSDYSGALKRLFSSSYKKDIAELRKYLRNGSNLSYAEALKYLTLIKDYSDRLAIISTDLYKSQYGEYYSGIDTDWNRIEDALSKFDIIRSYGSLVTNKLKQMLVEQTIDRGFISEEIQRFISADGANTLATVNISLQQKISNCSTIDITINELNELSNKLSTFVEHYNADTITIHGFISKNIEKSLSSCYDSISSLRELQDKTFLIKDEEEKSHRFSAKYGEYYNGIETDWDALERAMATFKAIFDDLRHIPTKLRDLYLGGNLPYEKVSAFINLYGNTNLKQLYINLGKYLSIELNEKTSISRLFTSVNMFKQCETRFNETYSILTNRRKKSTEYNSIENEIKVLCTVQEKEAELNNQKENILQKYENYYNGINTDWEQLFSALRFADSFRLFVEQHSLPRAFVEKICNDQSIVEFCKDQYEDLCNYKANLARPYEWISSLFDNSNIFESYYIKDLAERFSGCAAKKHLLEEWVDYCSNREKCKKEGLGPYIQEAEEMKIDENYIVDAYLKRFYRLWLDAILPSFPAVQDFRGRRQTQTIDEFCKLDEGQFKIAQARVRERALSRIPDFNSITVARDEIAILKRELNKQRRLMPLRKLFMAIPNLVTSLRPCFMMSPLSVSVFLEAQSYDFDMVIFDEASQVHTEDAIGAIMRGKQVIIVGDTKQLPPTSFFSTSLGDDDFDIDSDEVDDTDAGAYESILDEAVSILPERSLRWHYRSRHEHLIAFSNAKIYNSQLITFPSSVETAPDTGVEYIYVNNGIYDRGGKKNNIAEAQKVADLVFEHFRKHPNRSLGVVTFSEAQQNAVDAAIRQKRLKDSRYEQYFLDDREEPFFIKNLENVQGDERDTIIFSIGYAKDSRGIMYMNFGPLSREGGYRRLNVAITRAKHNVKLVGSIMPTDIELDKISSEGVRMLRSYIEFAQQGIIALEKELTFSNSLDFDSPFEEAVYDFLSSKGYNVVTQVGCSGFRIDMAVKHPTKDGHFAIGIECDGATYHSSRTARERDRLRQSVLEDMGWTIHRIWSTDWIKNQKTEEERLLRAVEKALGKVVPEDANIEDEYIVDETVPTFEIEERVEPSEISNEGYGFDEYKRAYPLNFRKDDGTIKQIQEIVYDVIAIEQPIHFEELCRRVAPLWERQKVTSVVRGEVRRIFDWYLKKFISEDKYEFVRLKDFTDVKVRIPNENDDYLRPIGYICDEELRLAMKTIAQHSFGITPDDLFIVTAREFGYKRTGKDIVNALRSAYDNMLKLNEATEIDGKVHIN